MRKVIKKIIYSFILIYTYNLIAVSYNMMIPMNYITLGIITILDIPGLILIVTILKLFYWG